MAKVKWAVAARKRRKRLLKQAKGYRGARRLHLLKAKETVLRAKVYRTRDRKVKKREYRNLWVIRLNAATRARGLTYSRFMSACRKAHVQLNRKQLSELAINDQGAFDQLVAQVTSA
ncbi:MAG: 50S ribosomal protein L20 [Candidatus Omnitrophica bacterium]|nr:50S ribosomal protein L20 [Candidatus Omnitrophota bacterium]